MALLGQSGLIRSGLTIPLDPFHGMFTMIVQTDNSGTSGNNQFTIPTTGGGYNYATKMQLVGGGAIAETTGSAGDVTLAAPEGAGQYKVGISGDFPRIYFNNDGDKLKVISIESWGNITWESFENAFYGCSNNANVSSEPILNVTNFANAWNNNALTSFSANVSSGTNFASAWFNNSLTSFSADVSSGTDFNRAWRNNSLTSFSANVSSGTNFDRAWNNNALTSFSANVSSGTNFANAWNTNALTSFSANVSSGTNFANAWFNNALTSFSANVSSGTYFANALLFNTLSTLSYSDLLIALEANNPNNSVVFHGGNSQYNAGGEVARNALLARGWTITDGGLE